MQQDWIGPQFPNSLIAGGNPSLAIVLVDILGDPFTDCLLVRGLSFGETSKPISCIHANPFNLEDLNLTKNGRQRFRPHDCLEPRSYSSMRLVNGHRRVHSNP